MTLEFNGVAMPTPKVNGFIITRNKVWSKNAGRNDNGDMVGTILKIKGKGAIEWPPLSPSQVDTIKSVVDDINHPYVNVRFTNETGNTEELVAYFGDSTYPVYTMNAFGKMILDGVKVDFIEQ